MKILIVSGFLGAGKTTFIKEMIRRSGVRPVIMENEYGENNLDARELGQNAPSKNEPKILEFMEGCVCCTMKDSFVNSVMTIFSGLNPEYLVIEPSGVGSLGNILENLKPLLHGNIETLKPVVVLTPRAFDANLSEWTDLYKDQIANAGIVVFSKCENEDPTIIEKVASDIRKINPGAQIATQHYSLQPDEWWSSLFAITADGQTNSVVSGAEDRFEQLSLHSACLERPAQLILLLEDCLRGELGHIVRAKGVLPVGGEMFRFDLADRQYVITGAADDETQCVFIGEKLDREALTGRMVSFVMKEAYDPAALKKPQKRRSGTTIGSLMKRPGT